MTLCLHKWKITKTFMDEKLDSKGNVVPNQLYIKEMQKCSKCHQTRAFTYSQELNEMGEKKNG